MSTTIIPGGGGSNVNQNQLIIGWAAARAFTLNTATYNVNGVLTSATVTWPDGSTGSYLTNTIDSIFNVPNSWTITHANSGLTVSQPLITRNSNGNITNQPALTIA